MSGTTMSEHLRCYDADDLRRIGVETYRTLRLAMVVLILALFISIFIEEARTDLDAASSISAYYYTAVHGVFIGTICAMGALLIVYKGRSQVEDALLNNAGFLAFVVAFVPTPTAAPWDCTAHPDTCLRLPGGQPVLDGIVNNFWVVVIAGVLAQAVWAVKRHIYPMLTPTPHDDEPTVSPWVVAAHLAGLIVIAALVIVFLSDRDLFLSWGHNVAAIAMFAFLIAVVVCNALTARDPKYRRWYWILATIMAAIVFVILPIMGSVSSSLFWMESLLLVVFGVFWVVQTIELRGGTLA